MIDQIRHLQAHSVRIPENKRLEPAGPSPGQRADYTPCVARRVFTDLDLNGSVPVRAQPRIGEWGPVGVPSTRYKKIWRILVSVAFVVAATGLFGLGYYVFTVLNGA